MKLGLFKNDIGCYYSNTYIYLGRFVYLIIFDFRKSAQLPKIVFIYNKYHILEKNTPILQILASGLQNLDLGITVGV